MSLHPTPDELIDKKRSLEYWESTDGDVNGMLGGIPGIGGFGSVTRVDLQGSRTFLARLGIGTKNGRYSISSALEGGSGFVSLLCFHYEEESCALTSDAELVVSQRACCSGYAST
jgi:hypothetical protein